MLNNLFFTFYCFQANGHGILVGIELLGGGHEFYGVTDAVDAVSGEMLESDLTTIAVEIYAAIGGRVTVGRQGVIGAAGVVARTLTGIFT